MKGCNAFSESASNVSSVVISVHFSYMFHTVQAPVARQRRLYVVEGGCATLLRSLWEVSVLG